MQEIDPETEPKPASWLGCMQGALEISGDIVGPIGAFDNWNPDTT